MGQVAIGENVTPDQPTEGVTLFSTVATPSIFKMRDDAGVVYTFMLLEKAQTVTGELTINRVVYGQGAVLTIAAGVITVTHSRHNIDTEGGIALDDLDTMLGGTTNMRLVVGTVNSGRDVVMKHGAGNILNASGADITLTASSLRREYMYDGTNWREIG